MKSSVFKMVEQLLRDVEQLRRVVWDLEEATVELPQAPLDNADNAELARETAMAIEAGAAGLLATARRLERLAATEHSFDTTHRAGGVETAGKFREAAANVLAAAFVKAKGGSIAQGSDWEPALRAAATAVDALADYVVARLMCEFRSKCSESGIFAVAAKRDESAG